MVTVEDIDGGGEDARRCHGRVATCPRGKAVNRPPQPYRGRFSMSDVSFIAFAAAFGRPDTEVSRTAYEMAMKKVSRALSMSMPASCDVPILLVCQ